MIIITSSGEFSCIYIFLVFSVCLVLFHFILFLSNFTLFGRVVFFPLFGVCPVYYKNPFLVDQKSRRQATHCIAYMSMWDYINQSWQSQKLVERNPSEYRSMRDYRNQWMSSPYCSSYNHSWGNHTNSSWEPRPPQYAPPEPPYYAPTSQQHPPTLSPVEQAILNLSKIVDNFIEEQRAVTVQANQEINTVESSLNKKLDLFQSEIDQKLDILQESISKLTNKLVHQEEENPEGGCLNDTLVEDQCQHQGLSESSSTCAAVCPWEKEEEITALLTEEGIGKEKGEEPQEPITQPNPIDLDPNAIAQLKNNPLPVAPSADQVYILPTLAAKSKLAAPAPKAKSNPSLPAMQNFKRLVATVHAFATTSKTTAAAHIAWHNGWFGCQFGFGASEPRHF